MLNYMYTVQNISHQLDVKTMFNVFTTIWLMLTSLNEFIVRMNLTLCQTNSELLLEKSKGLNMILLFTKKLYCNQFQKRKKL